MKARVAGMSSFQGVPLRGVLEFTYLERFEDGSGNASVRTYTGEADFTAKRWKDALIPGADLYVPVSAPGDPRPVPIRVVETFTYASKPPVVTTFERFAVATDLAATVYDYTQPQNITLYNQAEPLTMAAARALVALGQPLSGNLAGVTTSVDTDGYIVLSGDTSSITTDTDGYVVLGG